MYCLEKFQRELAYFLDIDLRDLPKVQEILQSQGYTAVKKNDEIIELGNGKANPKQKTIEKIDSYAKSDEFKALSRDKQEAILSLKNIEPSPMPQDISIKDLEHLLTHFEAKLDKEQREKFLTLFNDTKENPHIVLEVLKNGEIRQEYIKAYQHKESKDLYYLAISKDQRDITGIPTTQIQKVINDVVKSNRVLKRAENFQGISNTAAPLPKQTSLERSSEIIPQPNKQTFESFKQSLESQGIPIENEVKSFINFVEKNIYNENGVSFNQLNNALKTLNSYYKEAKDPNFKNHIKNAMDSFLREDIKAGIEAIFSQNKSAYKDISSLYATALSDYADMKEVLKIADKLKIRNATTEQNKALDSLLKLAKGQGDKLDNISTLTKALDKDNRALIELNMLSGLFQKSLYDENALQVIDSGKFFKELQALHKDTFQSKEAQDFINIMSDFDRLFKNDILIAKALKPTTTGQIGSSIATSIEGAVKFQMVKNAFSHLVRLMPHIPFMSGLNQKVQGAALRYHLQKALESSFSVSELKHTLQNRIAKAPYTSQTKSQIEKILTRVDTIQDELIEVAKRNAKQAQNAKDLQEYQTLQKYGVESLEKLSQDDFNHFVDSVLSGDIEALKSAPNIVYIADLNAELAKELGLNNGKIFLRKNDLHHSRNERKGTYNQHLNKDEIKQLPKTITETKNIYVDKVHNNFFITKELNENEIAMFVANKDELGNYVIHIKRVLKSDLNKSEYSKVGSGIEPHIERPTSITPPSHLGHLPPNTPKMQVHSQAIGEQLELTPRFNDEMRPTDIIPQDSTKAESSLEDTNKNRVYSLELESTPQKVESSDIIFTDTKGKEHTLTKEVQEQWLKTFNLKSLDESYTPKHSDEILQALGGKEIKLQLGSLKKLVAQGREKYIPQIKEVLDSPEAIMRDDMGEYLFIKHLKDDDYFVNVSFDNGEYLVSISNGIKETRNLNNKLKKGGSFIYQSPNFNSISQKLLQTSQYSANKIDSTIIPQQTLESTMKKFNYDEKKAKDLLEWHKDSSPLTKDENGLPKAENMLESKAKTQGQSVEMKDNAKKLENVFLDSNGKVDLSRIKATALPKVAFNNTKQFKNLFENKQGKYGIVKTPYKDVKINMGYAYKHFYQNTHNANRDYIKGAFFDVLQKPMFVIEQENERGLITYFYKVYKYENGNIGIFGIGVDSGGHIDYRTMYKDDNNQRLNQLLKLDSKKVVYMDNEWLP